MSDFTSRTMTDPAEADLVCGMMRSLYAEDAPASGDTPRDFRATVEYLLSRPDHGRVVLIAEGGTVCGYALLIPFWSNEMGGVVVTVDELYVLPEHRGRGLGRALFAVIGRDRPYDAVAVFLEVSAANSRARRLYEALGFVERTNRTLALRLPTGTTAELHRTDD